MIRIPDDDSPSWGQRQRRRESDIAFLEALKKCTTEEQVHELQRSKKLPKWRQVAIQRKLKQIYAAAGK